jgi:hypothetical protein
MIFRATSIAKLMVIFIVLFTVRFSFIMIHLFIFQHDFRWVILPQFPEPFG